MDNDTMYEDDSTDREVLADLEAVLEHVFSGSAVETELARRVQQRSAAVQEELRRKYGQLNVAVDLIREVRDKE